MSVIYASVRIRRKKRAAEHKKANTKSSEIMAQELSKTELGHELRAPLTAIRGLLEPIADGMITDETTKKRYFGIILKETERLSHLIADMEQFEGVKAPKLEPVNISELIADTAYAFSPRAHETGLIIENRSAEDIWALSDGESISQLLTIFTDNALLHAHTNGTVTLSVQKSDDFGITYKECVSSTGKSCLPKGKLVISVEDTGVGISKEALPRVFERFYKADDLIAHSGTGLGLAIAKRIADKLGETIIIQSEQGRGTMVSVTMPRFIKP